MARKIVFKKGSDEQKSWIKGNGICAARSVENKQLYHSNSSGIDDLHRILIEHGSTVSKTKIEKVLQNQNSYSLYHPSYHTFKRRQVYIHSFDDQWQADLVDMQQYKSENNNFNYILTVIDCLSQYA